ncbi:MAG: FAD-dependent oxidoreductase [Clostridia bacterium]|nr:FAD-dependent oxidoreductase [Clostridia bacterium]
MESVWEKTAKRPNFEPLSGDIKTDVLIIGGGMAGVLCAYMLTRAGVDCTLVEAGELCGGITGNTTAKITSQHGLIYHKLISKFGVDAAHLYYRANEAALRRYRELCEHIDCDFETKRSFIYSTDSLSGIERELVALDKIGARAKFAKKLPLPFRVTGAIGFEEQAQFHPLKFAFALSEGVRIFEHTKVLELRPDAVITNRGKIKAQSIVVTTHFPFLNKHGSYFLKLYQHRSYVLALQNAPKCGAMYLDESATGVSLRDSGDLLLLGGGGHRTGKKSDGWRPLEQFAQRYYWGSRIVSRWATQDCMTLDGVPYIGKYSRRTSNLYVATGFNKWGMSSSMVAAELLCDLVVGKDNAYSALFSPSRSILHPQLALNATEAVVNLITPTAPRCPHMGCALKYNRAEHSWDCPCHGSRFTKDMRLIDNPATGDIKK